MNAPMLKLSDEFYKGVCLDAIWRMAGIVLATRDESGAILSVNDTAARMFGYEGVLNSMEGMSVDELVPPDKRTIHKEHRLRFNAQPDTQMMTERGGLMGYRRDGSLFKVHIGLYPIDVAMATDLKEKLVLLMIV